MMNHGLLHSFASFPHKRKQRPDQESQESQIEGSIAEVQMVSEVVISPPKKCKHMCKISVQHYERCLELFRETIVCLWLLFTNVDIRVSMLTNDDKVLCLYLDKC